MPDRSASRGALAALVGLLLSGCGGSSSPDMAVVVPHNYEQINAEILLPSCANFTSCHSTNTATVNKLNMKDDAYAALVNVPAVNKQAASEGLLRVKPCDPDNSFIIKKLELPITMTDANVGYGSYMPNSNGHLPQPQIQAIRDWISRGALRSEPADVTGTTCMALDMSAAVDLAVHD
jgi:hypothetical protein